MEDNIHETIDDGFLGTEIEADSIDVLQEKEQAFINELRKEDELFQNDEHAEEIKLLEYLSNDNNVMEYSIFKMYKH